MQVLDEPGAGGSERDGPGSGVAVGVTGVVEDVAEGDPGGRHRGQDGRERANGSLRHDDTVARRAVSGMAGPFFSGIMIPAER